MKETLVKSEIFKTPTVRSETSKNSSEIYQFIKKIMVEDGYEFVKGYAYSGKQFGMVNRGLESKKIDLRIGLNNTYMSFTIRFDDDCNKLEMRTWANGGHTIELFLTSPTFKKDFIDGINTIRGKMV